MSKTKFQEPELIKAGDTRLKLGVFNEPPLVDCRVVAESNYQTLLAEIREKDEIIESLERDLKDKDATIHELETDGR